MTHRTKAVSVRLLIGGFLLGSPLLTGCGGGGSSSQTDQFATGASITKQAKVVVETTIFPGSTQPRTIYFLQGADGHNYFPNTLDAAFQTNGLSVQFTGIVVDDTEGASDGPTGIDITLTSIHTL